MFIPAHDAVVLYALEPPLSSITESPNGTTPAALPDAPSATSVLGYTNLPQTARGLNNSKGFAIGQQGAAYNKRGRVEPTATIEIRPGSVAALANLKPDSEGELPYLAIYVVVKGHYTDVYRLKILRQGEFYGPTFTFYRRQQLAQRPRNVAPPLPRARSNSPPLF